MSNQDVHTAVDSNFAAEVKQTAKVIDDVLGSFGKRVVGQRHIGQRLMMALIADGHVLLEGLPGLAKTTAIKTMASLTGLKFSRIQFTADLLPADVTGTQIYDPRTGTFQTRKGPVFANLLLADEINRAPAKVQSALLEAMQEHQVTLGGETHALEQPFLVMATQNPIEQEGTYPLPEAQVDRFMFKVKVGYATVEDERELLRRSTTTEWNQSLTSLMTRSDILRMRQLLPRIHVNDKIHHYIVDLVFATRHPEKSRVNDMKSWIQLGASPRASLFLEKGARANALLQGRDFVIPQDVKDVAMDILRHRITLSYAAEADQISSDHVVKTLLDSVTVP